MIKKYKYRSTIEIAYLKELENLLFFNSGQKRVISGIEASIEKFGIPKIIKKDKLIKITVGNNSDIQTIYAFTDEEKPRLAGIILYFRVTIEEITIIHIAVNPEYSINSNKEKSYLALMLVDEVKKNAARIKGIRFLNILYSLDNKRRIKVR